MNKKTSLLVLFLVVLFSFPLFATEKLPRPKTVFITGGAGFIGSNFLQYMFDKHPDYQFIVLDKLTYAGSLSNIPDYIQRSPRFKFVKGSVVDEALVFEIMSMADFVVHFAAETHVAKSLADDYLFVETDVMGTRSLMAALVKYARNVERFIHISTSEVYGTADYSPMDENHPLKPCSPYAAAKCGADRLVYAYSRSYDIPVVIVRPFNNYGPRQHLEKMIPRFITACIQGEPMTIHGSGQQKRDWIHTRDVSRCLDMILHKPDFSKLKNQEINIGSGQAISVLEIGQRILQLFNLSEDCLKFVADRPGQVELHIADNSKAKELLGWEPEIDIEQGLLETIDWYRNNRQIWQSMEKDKLVPITTSDGVIEYQ